MRSRLRNFRRQCIESAVRNGQKRQVVALSHVSGRQEGYLDTAGFREQAIAGPSRARALTLSTRWRPSSSLSLSPSSHPLSINNTHHHPTPPTTHAPPPPATLEISFALRARVMRG